MLDNMDVPTMKKAVQLIKGKAESEASGGITRRNAERCGFDWSRFYFCRCAYSFGG
jgi:nicotinate-nucleotide pyrophosphorylase